MTDKYINAGEVGKVAVGKEMRRTVKRGGDSAGAGAVVQREVEQGTISNIAITPGLVGGWGCAERGAAVAEASSLGAHGMCWRNSKRTRTGVGM